MNCRVRHCFSPGYVYGAFQCPFCSEHMVELTERKRALVLSISSFSVLDFTARGRANAIIVECLRYLANKTDAARPQKAAQR